jgi:hypothetical protein
MSLIVLYSTEIAVLIVNDIMANVFENYIPVYEYWLHRNDNTVSVFKRIIAITFFNIVILNIARNMNTEMFIHSDKLDQFIEKYANTWPIPFTG